MIENATFNRNEDGNPISVRIVDEIGTPRDLPLNGSTWWNDALREWLAADPANQISG